MSFSDIKLLAIKDKYNPFFVHFPKKIVGNYFPVEEQTVIQKSLIKTQWN